MLETRIVNMWHAFISISQIFFLVPILHTNLTLYP